MISDELYEYKRNICVYFTVGIFSITVEVDCTYFLQADLIVIHSIAYITHTLCDKPNTGVRREASLNVLHDPRSVHSC